NFLQAARFVGLPGVTAGALPVKMTRLKTADAASITIQALRMFMYERAQQAKVGTGSNIGRHIGRTNSCGYSGLPLFDASGSCRFATGQLGFEQTIQAQQGWMGAQRLACKSPGRPIPVLSPQLT